MSASLLFVALYLLKIFHILSADKCVFDDMSNSTQHQLHLEWFINHHSKLSQYDSIRQYNYFYTPCRNGTSCGTLPDQQGQIEQSWSNGICYIISRWNETIQPIYNNNTSTWTFYYHNGYSWDCDISNKERSIYINWHCNMSVQDGVIINILEYSECSYSMNIDSRWACLGQIPPSVDDTYFWTTTNMLYFAISFIVMFVLIILIIMALKRIQKRKEVQHLIKDIMDEDTVYDDDNITYGAVHGEHGEINMAEASSDVGISRLLTKTNDQSNFVSSRNYV